MARFIVKELAQERGLTADELARKSGVKFGTLRNLWQNRTKDPSYSTLSAVARALGVTIDDLIGEEETEDNRGALPMAA